MDEILKDFFVLLFDELQRPGYRKAIYHDYVDFCIARGRVPLNIGKFSYRFESAFNQVKAGLCQ